MTNSAKSDLNIQVPGIDGSDYKSIANIISVKFSDVSADLVPLHLSKLTAYLPAEKPAPQLYPWEVFAKLKKVKTNKATGPDMISPRLVKEFAYELSLPLTDILNCSFRDGNVPSQWKQAIFVPIPKQYPPKLDKLRLISLTASFAKIAEDFVTVT